MPRGNQVARFYTLVMDLSRNKRGVSAVALAARRDLPLRTVYRDLHALEAAGFPITTDGGARWRLIDGWETRVPFPLPLGQLLALYVARDLMKPMRGTPIARDLDALCERLAGPLVSAGGAQGELFPRLRSILATRSHLAIDYAQHSALIETLCRAAEARLTVKAVYYSDGRGELTQRLLDPCHLYFDPGLESLYLFAWCHDRRQVRTFAVHRFRQVSLTRTAFTLPVGFTPQSYLEGAFRIWRGEHSVHAQIRVASDIAGWISERRWHASQEVQPQADGSCLLTFTVNSTQELRRFVLQLGAAAEVIQPDALRREIGDELVRAAQRYRRAPRQKLSLDDTLSRHSRRGA